MVFSPKLLFKGKFVMYNVLQKLSEPDVILTTIAAGKFVLN